MMIAPPASFFRMGPSEFVALPAVVRGNYSYSPLGFSARHLWAQHSSSIGLFSSVFLGVVGLSLGIYWRAPSSLAFLIPISTSTEASVQDVGVYNIHPRVGREISAHLAGLSNLYFTVGGHRVSWDDTMESLKLGPISHLDLRIRMPGGANPGKHP
ncbi:hypothetical protein B0H14DRAFT_2643459 [Mycena olivaceomarginata]|nr:hypothetical protein B0H14DRAFT_2643459 [Mycena olivaceomarginata]